MFTITLLLTAFEIAGVVVERVELQSRGRSSTLSWGGGRVEEHMLYVVFGFPKNAFMKVS